MIDRRHFPRYNCQAQFRIITPDEQVFAAEACDISDAGISLTISHAVITGLSNTGLHLDVGEKFQLSPLLISQGNALQDIQIDCQVMHIRRLSQDHYLIGAWFNEPDKTALAYINRLIQNAHQASDG